MVGAAVSKEQSAAGGSGGAGTILQRLLRTPGQQKISPR